jgi:hypothetical protein
MVWLTHQRRGCQKQVKVTAEVRRILYFIVSIAIAKIDRVFYFENKRGGDAASTTLHYLFW